MLSHLLLNPKTLSFPFFLFLSPPHNPKNTFPHKISNSPPPPKKILKKYNFALPPTLKPLFLSLYPAFRKKYFSKPTYKTSKFHFYPHRAIPSNLLVTCW